MTDGDGQAFLLEQDGQKVTYTIPGLACVNPIGAGDTCSAIMLYRMVGILGDLRTSFAQFICGYAVARIIIICFPRALRL